MLSLIVGKKFFAVYVCFLFVFGMALSVFSGYVGYKNIGVGDEFFGGVNGVAGVSGVNGVIGGVGGVSGVNGVAGVSAVADMGGQLAPVHLMDTFADYDYTFFNDNIDINGDGDYTDDGERAGGNIAELLGVKDIVVGGEMVDGVRVGGEIKRRGYNSYLKSLVAGGATLKPVVIAVMDSGINMEHEIFEGRILMAHARNFVAESDVSIGINDLRDNLGHGTHTAATICDMTLPNVKILPIKIFSTKTTDPLLVRDAIDYLIDLKGRGMNIVAVNMSLGTDPLNPATNPYYANNKSFYQSCINTLVAADILPVVAAGNGDNEVGSPYPSFPSACAGTVSVSAFGTKQFVNYDTNYDGVISGGEAVHDFDDNGVADLNNAFNMQLAGYSNYAQDGLDSRIDITAPGHYDLSGSVKGIWSATKTGTNTISNSLKGTSMAAPFVVALYALLCSYPTNDETYWETVSGWGGSDIVNYVTPIHKALLTRAVAFGLPPTRSRYFGYGCVSVAAFVPAETEIPAEGEFDGWIAPAEYEDIIGEIPVGKAKIIVQATGGGAVLQNDYMPIGEYTLVDMGANLGVWFAAGGGYSILSIKVGDGGSGDSEVYSSTNGNANNLSSTEYTNGKLVCGKYTIAGVGEQQLLVVTVQFSVFSTEQINYVDTSYGNTGDGETDFARIWVIVLSVGVVIAIIYFLRSRKVAELSLQQSPEDDIDAEIARIIKVMEKRGVPQRQSDLDAEIAAIMREIERTEDENGEG
ncbi:MAG: S8 family peptidase [Christensenellaceae bacterium]|nr:S8 family peptidase [Christensenellaceae bacterium]